MTEFLTSLLAELLRCSVVLTAAAVVIGMLFHFQKITSPVVRRCVCFLGILQGCLIFQIPCPLPWPSANPRPIPAIAMPREVLLTTPHDLPAAAVLSEPVPVTVTASESRVLPTAQVSPNRPISWAAMVIGLWFAGLVGLIWRSMVLYFRFCRTLKHSSEVRPEWLAEWEELQHRAGLRRRIPLVLSEQTGPLLCRGTWWYRLIVPESLWSSLSAEQRLPIMLHELAHYQRRDIWKALAIRLLALPQWFNPMVWRLVRQFDECAEWACDDAVRRADADVLPDYARTLLQLGGRRSAHLLATSAAGSSGLAVRIRRLLVPQPSQESLMKKFAILVLAVGLSAIPVLRFQVRAQPAPTNSSEDAAESNVQQSNAGGGGGAALGAVGAAVSGFRDDFRGKMREEWKILNESRNAINFEKHEDCLTITTENGSIWNNRTNAKNICLIDSPNSVDDFVMTTRLVGFSPQMPYQQAGLICFNDMDNYLKFVFEFDRGNGGQTLTVVPEIEGKSESNLYLKVGQQPDELWLRMIKSGETFLCAASRDGKTYRTVAVINWNNGQPIRHMGLLAKNGGAPNTPGIDAPFDFFEIVSLKSRPELETWIQEQSKF